MELRRKIRKVMSKEQLNDLEKSKVIIHSKKVNFKGYYNVEYTQYSMLPYEKIVTKLIREKYSLDEELTIYRKSISNPENEEYITYNSYAEECKKQAKQFITERDAAVK